jgi:primosomal protein N' (replication factor Y)
MTALELPRTCPLCQAKLTYLGQGTQRAEDELAAKFPGAQLARMDSDTMTNAQAYQNTLEAFGRGEIDILLGTQMISKGLDFPNVGLVGVLNSDLAMTMPDFRAAERTFQLICQVAGRSGRDTRAGAARGLVVVQTFQPQEPAIRHACNHDYTSFVMGELQHRREFGFPPFGRLVRMVLSHKGYAKVQQAATELIEMVTAMVERHKLGVTWQGPQPPPMEKLMEEYRLEIVLRAESAGDLQRLVQMLRGTGALSGTVPVSVDVDPVQMM